MKAIIELVLGLVNTFLVRPLIKLLVGVASQETDITQAGRGVWVVAAVMVWGLVGLVIGLFLGDATFAMLLPVGGMIFGAVYGFFYHIDEARKRDKAMAAILAAHGTTSGNTIDFSSTVAARKDLSSPEVESVPSPSVDKPASTKTNSAKADEVARFKSTSTGAEPSAPRLPTSLDKISTSESGASAPAKSDGFAGRTFKLALLLVVGLAISLVTGYIYGVVAFSFVDLFCIFPFLVAMAIFYPGEFIIKVSNLKNATLLIGLLGLVFGFAAYTAHLFGAYQMLISEISGELGVSTTEAKDWTDAFLLSEVGDDGLWGTFRLMTRSSFSFDSITLGESSTLGVLAEIFKMGVMILIPTFALMGSVPDP